jgi:hypothetical protein
VLRIGAARSVPQGFQNPTRGVRIQPEGSGPCALEPWSSSTRGGTVA